MIIPYLILLIVLDAVGDAVKDKPIKHLVQAFNVLAWLMLPVLLSSDFTTYPGFLIMIGGYIGLRFLLFDAAWNITRGEKIDFIGTTSTYDEFLNNFHPTFVLYIKLLAGTIAVFLLLNFQYYA